MSLITDELSPDDKDAVLDAVFRWLDAADDAVAILDNFGETEAAERISSSANSLEEVIERAISESQMREASRVVHLAILEGKTGADD